MGYGAIKGEEKKRINAPQAWIIIQRNNKVKKKLRKLWWEKRAPTAKSKGTEEQGVKRRVSVLPASGNRCDPKFKVPGLTPIL
jgi:hypothetical protein